MAVPRPCEPHGGLGGELVTVSRSVLEALAGSARHLTERHDAVLGNSAIPNVRRLCRADCPACLAKTVLGDGGPL